MCRIKNNSFCRDLFDFFVLEVVMFKRCWEKGNIRTLYIRLRNVGIEEIVVLFLFYDRRN